MKLNKTFSVKDYMFNIMVVPLSGNMFNVTTTNITGDEFSHKSYANDTNLHEHLDFHKSKATSFVEYNEKMYNIVTALGFTKA